MKILREGIKDVKNWWVGMIGVCHRCKAMIELQEEDYTGPHRYLHIICPCCKKGGIVFKHPEELLKARERTGWESDKSGKTIPLTETPT